MNTTGISLFEGGLRGKLATLAMSNVDRFKQVTKELVEEFPFMYRRFAFYDARSERLRNAPKYKRCAKCGFRIKGANHEFGEHHLTKKRGNHDRS